MQKSQRKFLENVATTNFIHHIHPNIDLYKWILSIKKKLPSRFKAELYKKTTFAFSGKNINFRILPRLQNTKLFTVFHLFPDIVHKKCDLIESRPRSYLVTENIFPKLLTLVFLRHQIRSLEPPEDLRKINHLLHLIIYEWLALLKISFLL